LALLAMPLASKAQTTTYSPSQTDMQVPAQAQTNRTLPATIYPKKVARPIKPLSRLAFSGGISTMGVNMQAATNLNRYLNVRGVGNYFNYSISNISTNGFNVAGKANFATGGASLDLYPFPNHGFRLSPGVQFYNQNQISANAVVATGSSFTLSNTKYYSDATNPVMVNANLGLNANQHAATLTTGWGNMIPRKGEHWSFPFELGAAFTAVPTVNVGLNGSACLTAADAATNGPTCVNMGTNTTAQTNLTNQVSTWKNDLNPAKVYPILSFGISYSFRIR
jgi:hypothetical protein